MENFSYSLTTSNVYPKAEEKIYQVIVEEHAFGKNKEQGFIYLKRVIKIQDFSIPFVEG